MSYPLPFLRLWLFAAMISSDGQFSATATSVVKAAAVSSLLDICCSKQFLPLANIMITTL